MTDISRLKKLFYQHLKESYHYSSIYSLLSWDQQVNLPPHGAESRALQLELLERIMHQRASDDQFYRTVCELEQQTPLLSEDDQVNVRETKRSIDRQRKLPADFVSEKALATSHAFNAWTAARPANDFTAVKPHLESIIALLKKECDLVGYNGHPYDALLDVYEPYAKLSEIRPLLLALANDLKNITGDILKSKINAPALDMVVSEDLQAKICRRVCADFGYDFNAGRIDKSAHPFQATISKGDVRITVRYYLNNFLSALFSAMHEAGHALYEMGFDNRHLGTPMGSPISLGIHESQSRLWENFIGRSRQFSQYLNRVIEEETPSISPALSSDKLWRLCNDIRPSLIRVEADEVTYSLHVVIRLLLEEDLISGNLTVSDLPEAWNALYEKYLGLHAPNLKDGVLQDVHWYSGSIGYFPTYALGNLYAAQLLRKAQCDVKDLMQGVERGNFKPLLDWLRQNVHRHGMRFHASQLIENVSGEPLQPKFFLEYLENKFLKEKA